jgi:hypothetical protein
VTKFIKFHIFFSKELCEGVDQQILKPKRVAGMWSEGKKEKKHGK